MKKQGSPANRSNRNLTWRVPEERWQQAQEWELGVWRRASPTWTSSPRKKLLSVLGFGGASAVEGDDWNEWWAEQFEHYRTIPMEMDRAIELGCGPYTNMRVIRRGRAIKRIYCSDPLAREYAGLKSGWLAQAYRNREILLDDSPAEDVPFADDTFDLTVMINVLDHVRDAEACLASALRITKRSGLFVIGQDLTDDTDPGIAARDVGHPIMLDHDELDRNLLPALNVDLRKLAPQVEVQRAAQPLID